MENEKKVGGGGEEGLMEKERRSGGERVRKYWRRKKKLMKKKPNFSGGEEIWWRKKRLLCMSMGVCVLLTTKIGNFYIAVTLFTDFLAIANRRLSRQGGKEDVKPNIMRRAFWHKTISNLISRCRCNTNM